MTSVQFAGNTHTGMKRQNNEDVFVIDTAGGFCLAADGVGGAAAGEVASKIFADTVVEVFADALCGTDTEVAHRIERAFSLANKHILEHVDRHPEHEGMGCTAELLAFCEDGFFVGHVGDSRTYRLKNGQLKQLTQDHTLVQEQLREGLITAENLKRHPLRHVISRGVGLQRDLELDILRGKTTRGDLFLLCSDGLTDMVPDEMIHAVLAADHPLSEKVDRLIAAANDAGGDDNITVVIAAVNS